MKQIQSQIALVCVLLLGAPGRGFAQQNVPAQQNAPAQQASLAQPDPKAEKGDTAAGLEPGPTSHWYTRLGQPYRWRNVEPVNQGNSSRLDQLLRAGNLYLSLQDAIALALENNIDIEIQRYGFDLADTDLFRARATGNINGISTVPASVTSSVGTANFLASGSALPTADAAPNLILLNNAPVSLLAV